MLEVATNLKERGAKRIIANATFPLFTSGLEKFSTRLWPTAFWTTSPAPI